MFKHFNKLRIRYLFIDLLIPLAQQPKVGHLNKSNKTNTFLIWVKDVLNYFDIQLVMLQKAQKVFYYLSEII